MQRHTSGRPYGDIHSVLSMSKCEIKRGRYGLWIQQKLELGRCSSGRDATCLYRSLQETRDWMMHL